MTAATLRGALQAIAAYGLGAHDQEVIRVDAEWRHLLLDGITRERLSGLAIEASRSGLFDLSSAERDELLDRHDDQLGLDLVLERLLCEAADVLDRAHIEYRALKGPVVAHTLYSDPALRSFGDVDLLVSGCDFDQAICVLGSLGFRRRFVEPRRGFDARFSKGSCLLGAAGQEIDLHRTFAPGPYGTRLATLDLLARPAQHFRLGWREIPGVDRELGFVHACFHAALGDFPPRLVPLRDVAEFLATGFDADAVIRLVTNVRCATVLQRALHLVEEELGIRVGGVLGEWSRRHVPSRFDRWALGTYASRNRSYGAQAAVSVWVMPSLRDRVAFASALALPSRDYVRSRERNYGARIRHSVKLATTWRPPR